MKFVTIRLALFCAVLLAVAGCSRANFETAPVSVETSRGSVVCQLYTPRQVLWDEAVTIPLGMTKSEADGICREEGRRRR